MDPSTVTFLTAVTKYIRRLAWLSRVPVKYRGPYMMCLFVRCSCRLGKEWRVCEDWFIFKHALSTPNAAMQGTDGVSISFLLAHHPGWPLRLFSTSTPFNACVCECWSSSHALIQMIFLLFKWNYSALLFICSLLPLFSIQPLTVSLPSQKPVPAKALTQK